MTITGPSNRSSGKIPEKHNPLRGVNRVSSVDFTIGAETGGNTITVNIQLNNSQGKPISQRANVRGYLSNDANGDTITGTAPSSGIAAGTDGVLIETIADKAFWATSESDGDLDIVFTEAGAATWYLVIVLPDGSLAVSDAITFV